MRFLLMKFGMRPVAAAMALLGALTVVGCAGNGSSSSGNNAIATPTFSPGAGSYNTSQTVTIADTTKGAVLYCTIDGTTPTTSSPQCSQPTTVFKSEFLQAIAVVPGQAPSAVASAGYTINLNAAATPTFSPAGATYSSGQSVTIADATSGANIYYTTDGTVPMVNGATTMLYTGPYTLTKSVTLSAIAIASGYSNSGVASASYVVSTTPATPVISPAGGMFTSSQSVTITDATSGATIHYTTDGSTPTASSNSYSGTITVGNSQVINAIAISSGGSSPIATAAFTISIPAAAAPTFNPGTGTYTSTQSVMLSDATTGATIYYTVDGTMPTTLSSPYNGTPINVGNSESIKAIATAPGFSTSAVSSAAYTLNLPVAPPTFTPGAGTYTSVPSVTLSDTTSGAAIYYTTDGTTPTASSTAYGATPITVSKTETLSAIAIAGGATSTVATAAYIINVGPAFSGTVTSGTLPVSGATVQMYAAGQSGYGSAATVVSDAAVMTDSTGGFTLNYSCPASPGDLVYLVATGGHTGSNTGSNAGLAFMAALGSCSGTLPAKAVLNEATTVASAYALSQFMTGATSVGAAATAASYQGLTNAFKTVTNLVDLTTGAVLTHTPAYPTNLAGDPNILNNSVVPQARINTLANTLNLCAADGSGCSSLFSAATPGTGSTPTDTLQAILNIAQNPGKNAGTIYNVTAGSGPFMPALSAAPNDWTLALTFTGGGLGFPPGVPVPFSSALQDPNTFGQFMNTALAIDATGNVWVTGFNEIGTAGSGLSGADRYSGMIAKFNNQGAPLTPVSSLTLGSPVVAKYGGFIATPNSGGAPLNGGTQSPQGIAFDPSGNAWVIGGGTDGNVQNPDPALTEISPSLSVVLPDVNLGGSVGLPEPLTIDGVGNLWVFDGNVLDELDGTGKIILGPNNGQNPPLAPYGYGEMQSLIFDSNATSLWASESDGYGDFFQINPLNDTATVDYSIATPTYQYSNIVAGAADPTTLKPGNVYACEDAGGQTLDVFNVSSTSVLTSYPILTGRGCGNQMVMDGGGHIFTITGGATPGIIDEFTVTNSGVTPVSPTATGYTGTSSGETPTINPDPNAPPPYGGGASTPGGPGSGAFAPNGGVASAAIDGSGNLWVLNSDSGTTASPGNALVEFIGIAAPIVTPTSLALQFGQVAVRP